MRQEPTFLARGWKSMLHPRQLKSNEVDPSETTCRVKMTKRQLVHLQQALRVRLLLDSTRTGTMVPYQVRGCICGRKESQTAFVSTYEPLAVNE